MKTNAACCPRIIISGGSQWKRHPNCTRMFFITLLWPTRTKTLMHLSDLSWEFAVKFQIKSWVGMKEWMKRICPCFSLESHSRKALKKKYLFRISQSLKHYLLGVWISTGFTIQFDYDYHVNDSIQFDITMHHNASRLYLIYLVHFFACSEWNPPWKTSVWPRPLYCNSVPGCYRASYSLGHLCGEQQF